MNQIRALKIIKKEILDSKSEFINEVRIMMSLDHPNVVKLYEIYEDEYNYFLVLEYCGNDLMKKLLKERKITETTV